MTHTEVQHIVSGILKSARRVRRRLVKRAGRRLINAVAGFAARQGLVEDQPILDRTAFPSLAPLEAHWTDIRAELDPLLKLRSTLPAFHQISPDQKKISKGDDWKVFILYGFGQAIAKNCAQCPKTAALLRAVPDIQSAWFSILAPGYHIPRHRGVTKTILRAHLGLITPTERAKCTMQVDDRTISWEPGKLVIFDDFYPHEVWNDTAEERVVLIFDFNRPMRFAGRALNAALMWGLKRTAYFRDAERNLKSWDERLESAVKTADTLMEGARSGD